MALAAAAERFTPAADPGKLVATAGRGALPAEAEGSP